MTTSKKKLTAASKTEIQVSREDRLKKMLEEFSKLDPENIGRATTKRRTPLKTIEIGKIYSFPYQNGAKNKYSSLSNIELNKIKDLKEYYKIVAKEGEYNSYDDYGNTDDEEDVLKLKTTCLVCDIILKNAIYSSLHKKFLVDDKYDGDNEIVIMIDNKFYAMNSDSFKDFAKELTDK